jgi:hypothetical protein
MICFVEGKTKHQQTRRCISNFLPGRYGSLSDPEASVPDRFAFAMGGMGSSRCHQVSASKSPQLRRAGTT